MIGGVIANSVNAFVDYTPIARWEPFESQNGVSPSPARAALVSIVTVGIVLSLILFIGKFLWNTVLHELVPAIKPAKSVFQILGLAILISLMHPGNCSCGV